MADYSKTTRLFVGEDVLKAPPGDKFLRAVQRAVQGDFEVLGELGRGGKGKIVYLAREIRSRHLVALQLIQGEGGTQGGELWLDVLRQLDASVPAAEGKCPTCGETVRGWGRFCGQCGSDLSGVAPNAGDASADRLLDAVKQVAGTKYEVLGQMDRTEGGGVVYFAKEREAGKIVALRLQKDAPAADGRERYNLGQTMMLNSVVDSLLGPSSAAPPPPPSAPSAPVVTMAPPRTPLPPARKPERGRGMVYAAAALGALLVVAAMVWLLRGRQATSGASGVATADSAAPAAADSGEIQIGGALPARAAIMLDGAPVDGVIFRRTAGTHHLQAKAPGYTAVEQRIELRPGQTVIWVPAFAQVTAQKSKPRSASGAASGAASTSPLTGTAPPAPRPAPPKPAPPPDAGSGLAIRQPPSAPLPRDTTPSGPLTTGGATCASLFSALEWSRALVACEREASGGGTAAQRTLGTMYERGLATEASPAMAVDWYAKAAQSGDQIAQYRLGVLIRDGQGVKKNEKTALKWFQRSADQGDADAQYAVGQAYDNGDGVKRSRTTAAAWYLKSAEQGRADAQFRLGEFNEKGEAGFSKSDAEALKWYRLAAAQGHAEAREKVAKRTRPG